MPDLPHSLTPGRDPAGGRADSRARARPAALRSPHAGKWAVFILVAVGTFMTTLDGSVVNISLPAITRSLNAGLGGPAEWVIIGYLVTIAATLLTFGRLSDVIGRKPVWAAGLVVFTLGSAACGAAPSLPLLIAARAFQGIGAALLFAPGIALLTDAFPPQERGRAIGLNAVVVALGLSTGPILGGVITEYLSWRWIFYLNVPIGVLGLIATWKLLGPSPRQAQRFDPLGAALIAIGFAGLTLGLSFGETWGWTSPWLLAVLGTGLVALVAAVLVEQRVSQPILDLTLLQNRQLASALVSLILGYLALFAVSFLLPFYLEHLMGFSTMQSGLLLTPLPLTMAIVAPLSGSLADRVGTRSLTAAGLAVACVGLLFLAQIGTSTGGADIIWRLVIVGLGMGAFQAPNNRALISAAPASERGEASALLANGRVVGQCLSVAIATAVIATLGGAAAADMLDDPTRILLADQRLALQQTFLGAIRAALLVCAGFSAVGAIVALQRGNDAAPTRMLASSRESPGADQSVALEQA